MACAPVKPDRFNGSGDVERFLAHFEVVSKANEWSEQKQFLQLPACLTGPAFDFYRQLPAMECTDIHTLKKALKAEYHTPALPTDYAIMLSKRSRMPGETVMQYGEALKSLGRKAYAPFSEEQLGTVCRSTFLNNVDEAMRVQLLLTLKETESYRDLLQRARQLEQVMGPRVRHIEEQSQEHRLEDEVSKLSLVVANLEKKVDALQAGRQERTHRRSPPGPCPNCGLEGHWRRECTKPSKDRQQTSAAEVICFKCNTPRHFAKGCAAHFQ